MSQGYVRGLADNAARNLVAASFTWSSGYTTGRDRLCDGRIDAGAFGSSGALSSPQTLTVDLGSAQALSAIALLSHNLATGGVTVLVEAADNAAITTNAVTAKATTTVATAEPNSRDAVLQFPAVTKRYWRLTFTYTGNKRIMLGELVMATSVTTLPRQKAYGWGEGEEAIVNINEGRTGAVFATQVAPNRRSKRWPFVDMQGTSQLESLMTMWRAGMGGVQPILWIESIDSSASAGTVESQECLYGRIQMSTMRWSENDFTLYSVDELELVGDGRGVGM